MHLVFQMEDGGYEIPRSTSLREIGNICNIPDRQLLKRFVEERTFLIHTQPQKVEDKRVLEYYVPRLLRGYFFDPNRSRCSYSTSWIIAKWFEHAIEEYLQPDSHFPLLFSFFAPAKYVQLSIGDIVFRDIAVDGISDASRFLEHVRNGSARNDLLRFLGNLSDIHWFDIYTGGFAQIYLANEIVYWVCTTLVSRFPLTKLYHLITI